MLFLNHAFIIRDLGRIHNSIDLTTARINSKVDNCNSIKLNLPATQTDRLQLALNSATHAVTKTPKYHPIIRILKSL